VKYRLAIPESLMYRRDLKGIRQAREDRTKLFEQEFWNAINRVYIDEDSIYEVLEEHWEDFEKLSCLHEQLHQGQEINHKFRIPRRIYDMSRWVIQLKTTGKFEAPPAASSSEAPVEEEYFFEEEEYGAGLEEPIHDMPILSFRPAYHLSDSEEDVPDNAPTDSENPTGSESEFAGHDHLHSESDRPSSPDVNDRDAWPVPNVSHSDDSDGDSHSSAPSDMWRSEGPSFDNDDLEELLAGAIYDPKNILKPAFAEQERLKNQRLQARSRDVASKARVARLANSRTAPVGLRRPGTDEGETTDDEPRTAPRAGKRIRSTRSQIESASDAGDENELGPSDKENIKPPPSLSTRRLGLRSNSVTGESGPSRTLDAAASGSTIAPPTPAQSRPSRAKPSTVASSSTVASPTPAQSRPSRTEPSAVASSSTGAPPTPVSARSTRRNPTGISTPVVSSSSIK
jgi:hypothetical protein